MPQLDTIHTTMTLVWVWSVMYMLTKKIKTFKMTHPHEQPPNNKTMKTPQLPWL